MQHHDFISPNAMALAPSRAAAGGAETLRVYPARPGLEIVLEPVGEQRLARRVRRHIEFGALAIEPAQIALQRLFQPGQVPIMSKIGLIAGVVASDGGNIVLLR